MRLQTICSTSALLLLASTGQALAASAPAPAGQAEAASARNTGATCNPVADGTARAGDLITEPCASAAATHVAQAAASAQASQPEPAMRLAQAASPPPVAQLAQATTPPPVTRLAQAAPPPPVAQAEPTPAIAQTGPAQAAPQGGPAGAAPGAEEQPAEVVITGSRIARPDYVSNQPMVSVSSTELAAAGKVNIESALEQTPQFSNGQDENYNSNGPNGGRATLNLRGLGQQRTLVLLDGRRLAPTDGTGVANLNEVPQAIVDSVQVISGGASAADGGIGKHQDYYINLGSAFADNKGHAMLSVEHTEREAVVGNQIPFFFFGGQGANLAYGAYSPATAPTGLTPDLPSQATINAYF